MHYALLLQEVTQCNRHVWHMIECVLFPMILAIDGMTRSWTICCRMCGDSTMYLLMSESIASVYIVVARFILAKCRRTCRSDHHLMQIILL